MHTAANTGLIIIFCGRAKLHQWNLESKLVLKEFTSKKLHKDQKVSFTLAPTSPSRGLADSAPAHGVLSVVQRGVRQGEVDVTVKIVVVLVLVEQAGQEI